MKSRVIRIDRTKTLFPHSSFFFNQGITCLIGSNGSGKTLLMKEITRYIKENNIPYYFFDTYANSKTSVTDKLKYLKDTRKLLEMQQASQGQQTIINITNILTDKIGPFITECIKNKAKEAWILLDSVDTGLSIDNIIALKEFFKTLITDCESNGITLFLILSGNSFELVRDQQSVNVSSGSRVTLKNYETYKKMIIKP